MMIGFNKSPSGGGKPRPGTTPTDVRSVSLHPSVPRADLKHFGVRRKVLELLALGSPGVQRFAFDGLARRFNPQVPTSGTPVGKTTMLLVRIQTFSRPEQG